MKKLYNFSQDFVNLHISRCDICKLDEVNKDIINMYILNNASGKFIISECEKLGIEINYRVLRNHKDILPLTASTKVYTYWHSQAQNKIKRLETAKDTIKYDELKNYFDTITKIVNKNYDIISAKQETLLYLHNMLLPQLLKTAYTCLLQKTDLKYITGMSRMLDIIINKSVILESSVGNRLSTNYESIEENKEEKDKVYDPKALIDFIRSTEGKI